MNNKRATSEQLELLVSWVADRPSMASGRCEGLEGRVASKRDWDELALTLNAIRFAAKKPGEKWQQTWRDLKGNAKKKAWRHRVELSRIGGGAERIPPLTPLEEKVLVFVGRNPIEGKLIEEMMPLPFNDIEIEVLHELPESELDEEALSAMPGPVPTDILPATPGPSGVKRKASDQGLYKEEPAQQLEEDKLQNKAKINLETKKIDLEAKKIDLETKKIDLEAKKIELEAKKIDLEESTKEIDLEAKIDLEVKKIELEAKKIDLVAKEIDLEAKKIDLNAKKIDLEAKKTDLEAKKIDLEIKKIELSAKKTDLEAKKIDLEGKKIELIS